MPGSDLGGGWRRGRCEPPSDTANAKSSDVLVARAASSKDTQGTQPVEIPNLSKAYGLGAAPASGTSMDSKEQNSIYPENPFISSRPDSAHPDSTSVQTLLKTPVAIPPQTF
jgi:hypothetical protein